MSTLPVFVPVHHALHQPRYDYSDGLPPVPHPECARRLDVLLDILRTLDPVMLREVEDLAPLEQLEQLHDADYLAFLQQIADSLPEDADYLPGIFRDDLSRAPMPLRGGMYCREIGTPIGRGSFTAARNSAAAALAAAEDVARGEDCALALCRPPGHHAGRRRYGGYCYLNNACLAARQLGTHHGPVAVLDVDYHLGDGSLEFADASLHYWSLHADPWTSYPWLDAQATCTTPHVHLVTLPDGCDGTTYLGLLQQVVDGMAESECRALVLSLGFDTLGTDTIQDRPIRLEVRHYRQMAERIRALELPTVIVLEGGYHVPRLGESMRAFLEGWLA